MKKFSELDIETPILPFVGDKIKISKLLNKDIVVLNYRIGDSKYNDKASNNVLTLHIQFEGESRILFTGSTVLMNQLRSTKPEHFPFSAIIVKEGEYYKLT